MEIRLHPEKEAQLAKIAAQRGLRTDELAQQVLSHYLEDDTRFIEAVNQGTRELVFSGLPYIDVYRIQHQVVELPRIYHGAQDWP